MAFSWQTPVVFISPRPLLSSIQPALPPPTHPSLSLSIYLISCSPPTLSLSNSFHSSLFLIFLSVYLSLSLSLSPLSYSTSHFPIHSLFHLFLASYFFFFSLSVIEEVTGRWERVEMRDWANEKKKDKRRKRWKEAKYVITREEKTNEWENFMRERENEIVKIKARGRLERRD